MKEMIEAYARRPHAVKKLVQFTGYVPANIIDKEKKLIASVKIPKKCQQELWKADTQRASVDVCLEGHTYNTRIAKIFQDEATHSIEEVEFVLAG